MTANILTSLPPDTLVINGRRFTINTDFQTCLLVMLAFEDNDLTTVEKQFVMLDNLFNEQIPADNVEEAITQAVWFLDCGQRGDDAEDGTPSPRVYSFSKDDRLIYAAFRQTHGIDLHTAEMHWWQFMSLFMDLGSETVFTSLVGLRKRVKTGRASKEERALALEMGSMFEVPEIDNRTLEEKERRRAFMDQYREARKRKDEQRKRRKEGLNGTV